MADLRLESTPGYHALIDLDLGFVVVSVIWVLEPCTYQAVRFRCAVAVKAQSCFFEAADLDLVAR